MTTPAEHIDEALLQLMKAQNSVDKALKRVLETQRDDRERWEDWNYDKLSRLADEMFSIEDRLEDWKMDWGAQRETGEYK